MRILLHSSIMLGAAVLMATAHTAPAPRALRIMPFGDSITEWDCRLDAFTDASDRPVAPNTPGAFVVAPGGYRGYLSAKLSADGIAHDLVGSRYRCGNHEGYSGRTIEWLSGVANRSITLHGPDIVCFMGGTNDFFFDAPVGVGSNTSAALSRLRRLIDTAFRARPSLTFLLSTVTRINATRCASYPSAPWHPPPCPQTMPAAIADFNAQLPSLVREYSSRGHRIFLHDVDQAGFEWQDWWIWGIHFNATGFEKMAESWRRAIHASLLPGFKLWRGDAATAQPSTSACPPGQICAPQAE